MVPHATSKTVLMRGNMGKITRQASKLHDEAMAILNLDRKLTIDEVEKVYQQYNPLADHDVGKGAVFFTPMEIAWEFAVMCQPKGAVIDLCAGIGMLSYNVLKHDYAGYGSGKPLRGEIKRLVAIEHDPLFVEYGKRLLPEVEWYCANVFDLDLLLSLGEFDCAISNPPYGNIPSKSEAKWLKVKGPAQWQVIEIALRMAYNGGMFIIPENDSDYSFRINPIDPQNPMPSWMRDFSPQYTDDKNNKEKYLEPHFPGVIIFPASVDISYLEAQWVGANPKVAIVDVNVDDVTWERPYGFSDVLPKPKLIDAPVVKKEKLAKAPKKVRPPVHPTEAMF